MDITQALAPKSDQLDAVDLLGSPPQVFTITDVREGSSEQPVQISLAEFPRVWRPSKGMLRVLAGCWGKVTADWVGRKVELYCDPDVMFGKERVGGIRISRLSHIDKRASAPMILKRGKSTTWTVEPLPNIAPTEPTLTDAQIAAETDRDVLAAWWKQHPDQRANIEARVAEIKSAETVTAEDAFDSIEPPAVEK